MPIDRRRFLQAALGLTSGLASCLASGRATAVNMRHERTIPSTGEKLPVIGLGSWLVFAIDPDDEKALASRQAVIAGYLPSHLSDNARRVRMKTITC